MSQWTDEDPGAGSTGHLSSSSTRLSTQSTGYENAAASLTLARDGVGADSWTGPASDAWRTRVTTVASTLSTPKGAIDTAKTAIDAYIAEVDEIARLASGHRTSIDDAQSRINALSWSFRWPWDQDGIDQDQRDRTAAISSRETAQSALAELAERRQTADDTVVAALDGSLPESWNDVRQAITAAGIDLDDLDADAVNDLLLGLAGSIIDTGGSEEDRRALDAMLSLYGDDRETLSTFYTSLGGVDTLRVVDALGTQYYHDEDPAVLSLAQTFREGLSVGSQDWSSAEASAFAYDMFRGLPDHFSDEEIEMINNGDGGLLGNYRWGAIGYLFGDPGNAPMGEQLTVASAGWADQIVRVDGMPLYAGFTPPSSIALIQAEQFPGEGVDYSAPWQDSMAFGTDVAGDIFSTLAVYPDAALEFFDPRDDPMGHNGPRPELGDDRVDYWFGEHDWAKLDGYEAPGDLLMALTQAEGGPYSAEYDSAQDERIAGKVSDALFALTAGEGFAAENISPDGAASLGGALVPYLDGFAEKFLDWAPGSDSPGADTYTAFGTDETRFVPSLSSDAFTQLLGAIGAEESGTGAQVLADASERYQVVYLAAGADDPNLLSQAISRTRFLQGAMDGSEISERVSVAERHDAAVDAQVDAVNQAVGLIPIPYINKGLDTGMFVIDTMYDVLRDEGKGWVVDLVKDWNHELPAAIEDADARVESYRASYLANLSGFLEQSLQGMAAGGGPQSAEYARVAELFGTAPELPADGVADGDFVREMQQWWQQNSQDLGGTELIPGLTMNQLASDYDFVAGWAQTEEGGW